MCVCMVLHIITMTLKWARWRLKSPASRLFTQPFIQAQIKENIKAPRHLPLCRSLVNSPHKGQWRRALMFSLICAWINGWINNREAGDLRCQHAHCDVTLMIFDTRRTTVTYRQVVMYLIFDIETIRVCYYPRCVEVKSWSCYGRSMTESQYGVIIRHPVICWIKRILW